MSLTRSVLKSLTSLLIFAAAQADANQTITQGMAAPEGILIHEGTVYVSNMSGSGRLKDGVGWITTLDLSGNVQEKFVEGLDAPKGMAVSGGKLFVTDIDQVVVIDLQTKVIQKIAVPGSKLLNDVAADSIGNIFFSDTLDAKIYRIEAGSSEVTVFMTTGREAPNGLLVVDNKLLVASWGQDVDDQLVSQAPGRLFEVDLLLPAEEQHLHALTGPLGYLDGIAAVYNGQIFVSDKRGDRIYSVDPRMGSATAINGPNIDHTDAADIALDPVSGDLYIPNTKLNKIQSISADSLWQG